MSRAVGRNPQEGRALAKQARVKRAIEAQKQLSDPAYHEGRPEFAPKENTKSQLPTFMQGDSYTTCIGDSPRKWKVIELTCQRKGCLQTFIVVVKHYWNFTEPRQGGSCPYCFKTSWRGTKP